MTNRLLLCCALWVCGTLAAPPRPAPAADPLPTFTTAAAAGPAFQIQGEYVGQVGGRRPIAAQVIALGNGQFEGILYRGGLPGAGWDGDTRSYFRGQREGETTQLHGIFGERLMFTNPVFRGTIRDGQFSGRDDAFRNVLPDTRFQMQRVLRQSPTLGAPPPAAALVLFDGSDVRHWQDGQLLPGGWLKWGTETRRQFKSIQFHLEFRCPFMPTARGMQRGNSGVYIKKEWELQIVDSFGWTTENRKYERLSVFARAGGIHEMVQPRFNMSYPPLSWQTFDGTFEAARFDAAGQRTAPAMLTVRHKGALIHDRYVLPPAAPGKTESREHLPGPLLLQDHGNPVVFRNIWVVEP